MRHLALLLWLIACEPSKPADPSGPGDSDPGGGSGGGSSDSGDSGGDGGRPIDEDGDGYSVETDCDDADITVSPRATEQCDDGKDNDCDGLMD